METDDDARKAFGTVPRGTVPPKREEGSEDPSPAGPTSPGPAGGTDDRGPESGGYDNRPVRPTPDNRKGGYGAG